jgi:prophage antirepressor-like protein
MTTSYGNQCVTFLTEKGLYELLFKSRKLIAKIFRNWIFEVIKQVFKKSKHIA